MKLHTTNTSCIQLAIEFLTIIANGSETGIIWYGKRNKHAASHFDTE